MERVMERIIYTLRFLNQIYRDSFSVLERVERMERVFFKSNYREVIFLAEDKIQILEGGCQNTLSRLSRLSGRFSISKEVHIDPKSMTDDIKMVCSLDEAGEAGEDNGEDMFIH